MAAMLPGSHLSNGRINVGLLRECSRRELLQCLDKHPGSKALVWDEKLTGPFGLVAEYPLLREHEVDVMFQLKPGPLPPSQVVNIIFITRPIPSLMDIIAENILKEEEKGGRKDFHIIFVPRKTLLCERRLLELGVSFVNIEEYPLELIPLDNDLLSLEMDSCFKECYLENDFTSLYYVANSMMSLQLLYGVIPRIYAKGDMAKRVLDMMMRKKREMADTESQIPPQIDTVLLLDRNVDLLTPLFTQLTYEGLIDELYGIHNTTAKFPGDKFPQPEDKGSGAPQQQAGAPKKVVLNSADELYSDIRDLNFSAVGVQLSRKAKQISAAFEEHKSAKTVGEMKQYVQRLPYMQKAKASLAMHMSIAELIKEKTDDEDFRESIRTEQEFAQGLDTDKISSFIEKFIALKMPLTKVLRLICIQCQTNNGFKPKMLEYYVREIVQTYGFDHVYRTLTPLETVGLLRPQGARTYTAMRKSIKLFVEEVREQNPDDIAYVFSGYAPLSVRLAQFLSRPQGWRGLEEVLRLLPGPTIEERQPLPPGLQKRSSSASENSGDTPPKVTLVFFIGGCTYAEVAALRFLSQQENSPTDFIIATTKIINGTCWLESLMEKEEKASTNPFSDRELIGDLARASVRAAEWTRTHLHGRVPSIEGHILASAVQSLRLVGHSLNATSGEISARMKSEIDAAGLATIPTGRVAHYIHGVYSICQDPRSFHQYNLFKSLKSGTTRFPKLGFNHYFQYGTAVLGLCVGGYTHATHITTPLVKKMTSWSKDKTYGGVDTVAMATMALACMYDGRTSESKRNKKSYRKMYHALKKATNWLIRYKQRKDGAFGNSITTALVTQALLSAKGIVGPYKKRWNCDASLRYLLEQQQNDGSYGDLMSTIQVMPALIGAIPADLKKLKCHTKTKKTSIISVCVRYEFEENSINNLDTSPPPPVHLNVTSGTSAHKLLRLAAQRDQRYTFTTRKSSFGYVVTAINGVAENGEQNKHWMMLSAAKRFAPAGIDTFRPKDKSCVIFRYMKLSS